MKSKIKRTLIAGLVAAAVMTAGTNAFAGKGMGMGSGDDDRGSHHNRKGDCAYMNADLTDEQRQQMDAQRKAFFAATKKARQELYAKKLELRAEMAKSGTDPQKASALQKEISTMQADLDQKHLDHVMAMRKINPDAGRGYGGDCPGMGGHGKGGGMGHGSGACRQ